MNLAKAFFGAILLILVLSAFGWNNIHDIQLHDLYIVFPLKHLGLLSSVFLGFIGVLYWLVRKVKLIRWISYLHAISTIFPILVIILLYLSFSVEEYSAVSNKIFWIAIWILFIAQPLFLINVILGMLHRSS